MTSFCAFSRTWRSNVCHAGTGTSLTLALWTFGCLLWEHRQLPKWKLGNECQMADRYCTCHCGLIRFVSLSNQPWWFGFLFALFQWEFICTRKETGFLYLWNVLNTLKTKINLRFVYVHLLLLKERGVRPLSGSVGKCCFREVIAVDRKNRSEQLYTLCGRRYRFCS